MPNSADKAEWTDKMVRKETELGRDLLEFIREQFEDGLPWSKIAQNLGISKPTMVDWRDKRLKVRAVTKRVLETRADESVSGG